MHFYGKEKWSLWESSDITSQHQRTNEIAKALSPQKVYECEAMEGPSRCCHQIEIEMESIQST